MAEQLVQLAWARAVFGDGDAEGAAILFLLKPEGARRVAIRKDDDAVIEVAGAPDVVLLVCGHRLHLMRAALVALRPGDGLAERAELCDATIRNVAGRVAPSE